MTSSLYSSPEWEALLAAVGAAPDDDLPRLVAADWLEERGESDRAEFIRIQCELASKPDNAERTTALKYREKEHLISPTGVCWWALEACPNIVTMNMSEGVGIRDFHRVTFRRGFPHEIVCAANDWLRHGNRIVPRQPIRSIALRQCDEVPMESWWGMLPSLGKMESICLDTRWGELPKWLRERLPEADITPRR